MNDQASKTMISREKGFVQGEREMSSRVNVAAKTGDES